MLELTEAEVESERARFEAWVIDHDCGPPGSGAAMFLAWVAEKNDARDKPVAWFNPANPNAVISAAQYPHVLAKNKVGYAPCYTSPPSQLLRTVRDALKLCEASLSKADTLRHITPQFPALDQCRAALAAVDKALGG